MRNEFAFSPDSPDRISTRIPQHDHQQHEEDPGDPVRTATHPDEVREQKTDIDHPQQGVTDPDQGPGRLGVAQCQQESEEQPRDHSSPNHGSIGREHRDGYGHTPGETNSWRQRVVSAGKGKILVQPETCTPQQHRGEEPQRRATHQKPEERQANCRSEQPSAQHV